MRSNDNILNHSTDLGIGTAPQLSSTIHFYSSGTVEVMRLSRDGVWANPDVPVDETAQVVLNALDYNIKLLVERAVEQDRAKLRHCMKVMQEEADAYLAWHSDTNATLLAEIAALKEYLNDKG